MKKIGAWVVALLPVGPAFASTGAAETATYLSGGGAGPAVTPMSASANTVASRGLVSPSQPLYGGFSLAAASTVYILVRGNSMNSLGITSNYLDAPRLRLFNQANADIFFDAGGNAGGNGCQNSGIQAPVVNYYQSRGAVQSRDACLSGTLPAGVYTFTVNSSIAGVNTSSTTSSPSSGEVLFEVTLGP